MITGFNTDVEHNGTVYHVQTEDKGLETPFILSLVYVGGAILASKRSPYNDLVAAGFDSALLSERLQRQHKLICAAISAGRVEDLKRLSRRDAGEAKPKLAEPHAGGNGSRTVDKGAKPETARARKAKSAPEPTPAASDMRAPGDGGAGDAFQSPLGSQEGAGGARESTGQVSSPAPPATHHAAEHAAPTPRQDDAHVFEIIPAEIEDELHVNLLEERDYRAGEIVTLRVAVARGAFGAREIVRGASVVVKVLGTEFRPLILTSKTDADGVACVHVWLPRFQRGRAAILVRATADDCSAELRRAILQG